MLRASELGYTTVKVAGAAYLLWLGAKLLLKPRRHLDTATELPAAKHDAFWRGFMTNLLNPKIGVFYITFLPQFVRADASVATYSFFLASLHVALTLIWFAALIAATVPLGRFLRQPKAARTLDYLTGGIFIAFGLKPATSSGR